MGKHAGKFLKGFCEHFCPLDLVRGADGLGRFRGADGLGRLVANGSGRSGRAAGTYRNERARKAANLILLEILEAMEQGRTDNGWSYFHTLISLDLSFTNIGGGDSTSSEASRDPDEMAWSLGKFLLSPVGQRLLELDVSSAGLRGDGLKRVCAGLEQGHATLTALNLASNDIAEEGAKVLAESLQYNVGLTHLNVSDNRLRDNGVLILCAAIVHAAAAEPMISLDLSYNECRHRGAQAVANMITDPKLSLTALNLEGNLIGGGSSMSNHSVKALANALKDDQTLTELHLGQNRIGKGAKHVADMLQKNSTLRVLDLGEENMLGQDHQTDLIRTALHQNALSAITSITLNDMTVNARDRLEAVLDNRHMAGQLELIHFSNVIFVRGRANCAAFLAQPLTYAIQTKHTAVYECLVGARNEIIEIVNQLMKEKNRPPIPARGASAASGRASEGSSNSSNSGNASGDSHVQLSHRVELQQSTWEKWDVWMDNACKPETEMELKADFEKAVCTEQLAKCIVRDDDAVDALHALIAAPRAQYSEKEKLRLSKSMLGENGDKGLVTGLLLSPRSWMQAPNGLTLTDGVVVETVVDLWGCRKRRPHPEQFVRMAKTTLKRCTSCKVNFRQVEEVTGVAAATELGYSLSWSSSSA
jgi:hypothetical protein